MRPGPQGPRRAERTRVKAPARAETILWDVLRRLGIDARVREGAAVVAWPEVVGPGGAARSRAVGCQSGRLVIEVENSPWMQELSCLSGEIRAELNRRMGEDLVREIVFRAAPGRKRQGPAAPPDPEAPR